MNGAVAGSFLRCGGKLRLGPGDFCGATSLVLERYALSSCSARGFVSSSELFHSELLILSRRRRRGLSGLWCQTFCCSAESWSFSASLPFLALQDEYLSFLCGTVENALPPFLHHLDYYGLDP